MQTVSNRNFSVEVLFNNKNNHQNEVQPGDSATNSINIRNNTTDNKKVYIWLVPLNGKSQEILYWSEFKRKEDNLQQESLQLPLELEAEKEYVIELIFTVPLEAKPGLYEYQILVEDNSGKLPTRYPQQLRVLRSDITIQWGIKPEFYLEPLSNSSKPISLKAGESTEIKVKVENKSKRVDTFYVTCPDLEEEWFYVKYPESPFIRPGLVQETDGLYLNPRQSGECTLVFNPPKYTPAGSYFPTVQLISRNSTEDLVLLDIVYLKILPDATLTIDMLPQSQKISGEAVSFDLNLINKGNIDRKIAFDVQENNEIFKYTFYPSLTKFELSPGELKKIYLEVEPKRWKWWLRCFKARQQEINFDVELKDDSLVIPNLEIPKISKVAQGTLIWVSRPWWLFWLLIVLGLLSLGGVGFFIWNKYLKYHLPPFPEVTNLTTTNNRNSYQKGEAVLLNWNINHFDKVKKVVFITLHNNVEVDREKFIFQHDIDVKKFQAENNFQRQYYAMTRSMKTIQCRFINQNITVLKCYNYFTKNFKKSGEYAFKIKVFTSKSGNNPADVEQKTITVHPHPSPRISSLKTNQPNYQATENLDKPQVDLTWDMTNPGQIKELNLIALKPDNSVHFQENYNFREAFEKYNPKADEYFKIYLNKEESEQIIKCEKKEFQNSNNKDSQESKAIKPLSCNLNFLKGLQPGDYIFQLAVVPRNGENNKLETKKTPVIKVLPITPAAPTPNPQIINFFPSKPSYKESKSNSVPISLDWEIANPQNIQEIKIVGLDSEGNLNDEDKYPIQFPQSIPNQCEEKEVKHENDEKKSIKKLICQNVPTTAIKAGSYKFNLIVTYKDQQTYSQIVKSTPNIKIQPPPEEAPTPPTDVDIAYFTINGEKVSDKPKHIIKVHREIKPPDINLSWKVKKGEDIEVELLPSPGLVPTEKNNFPLPVSQSSGSETITLKVKNKQTGEEKTQSVVIQTIDTTPTMQTQPQFNPQSQQGFPDISNPANSGNNNQNQPQPSNSNGLSPIELPPQPDSNSRD